MAIELLNFYPGTLLATAMALIVAICGSIIAARGQLPIFNAVLEWVQPFYVYFLCTCLYSRGSWCNVLIWVQVVLLTLSALGYIIAAAYPSKLATVEQDLGGIDLEHAY